MTRNKRNAFTLIELLVVVAIIALLISILLPSLASAREGARASVCLSSLKQMGSAVTMYTVDNSTVLPGPVHNPIYHDTGALKYKDVQNPGSLYYRLNLPYYIQKYMADRSGSARLVDQVLTCPTASRISVAPSIETAPGAYSLPAGHYIANTGGGVNLKPRSDKVVGGQRDLHPYYGTVPRNYFGWSNIPASLTQIADDARRDPQRSSPKKVDTIKKHSEEWMVADLWYWAGSFGMGFGSGLFGTWFIERTDPTATTSVFNGGGPCNGFKIPSYPYHNTTASYDPGAKDTNFISPRIQRGKTNAVYFDGHAAGVRIWQGTVNPRFSTPGVIEEPVFD